MTTHYLMYFSVFFCFFSVTLVSTGILIPKLRENAKQPIYNEGPGWHSIKNNTPTLGGISFIISSVLFLLVSAMFIQNNKTEFINICSVMLFALGNSIVGLVDDYIKIKRKNNAGLSPLQKILLQVIISLLFLISRSRFLGTKPIIPFFGIELELGVFYYPICVVILLATVNCANLTDGIDGLASSVALTIGAVIFLSSKQNLSVELCSLFLVSISLGFLFFNINPAKIFMGDTGSLFLGGLIGAILFSINKPLSIAPICVVYLLEGASVILQVIFFKFTKRRIFKMAPIHHHFEKCGFNESKICLIACFITLVFSLLTTSTWSTLYEI